MKIAKKSLSQNFLNDKNIATKIINETDIKNKNILEIGPGYGFLTDLILKKKPKKLIIVEKDNYLSEVLENKYKHNRNLVIINKDITKINFNSFKNINIISNLPYNISSKLILKLLKHNQIINEMLFMIQKEVAIKFDYKLKKINKYKFITFLSSEYNRCFNVSKNVFFPRPKIESTVVKFKLNKKNINWSKIDKFTNIIFLKKRKKINKKVIINGVPEINLILKKRIDEITLSELLKIYNFF